MWRRIVFPQFLLVWPPPQSFLWAGVDVFVVLPPPCFFFCVLFGNQSNALFLLRSRTSDGVCPSHHSLFFFPFHLLICGFKCRNSGGGPVFCFGAVVCPRFFLPKRGGVVVSGHRLGGNFFFLPSLEKLPTSLYGSSGLLKCCLNMPVVTVWSSPFSLSRDNEGAGDFPPSFLYGQFPQWHHTLKIMMPYC